MRCMTIDANGYLVDVTPQPSDWSTCALVVQSGSEAGANPFYLSAADGESISLAIMLVWGVAWGWRALIEALKDEGDSNHV